MSDEPNTNERHPDLAELDLLRTGEASDAAQQHVEACAACRETLASLGRLAADLQAGPAADTPIPQAFDDEMRAAIGRRALEIRVERRGRALRSGVRWFSRVAAVLVAGVAVTWLAATLRGGRLREDINGDGAVDIVDAYVMAARLESGGNTPDAWDLNADGSVDDADVQLLATRAVRLENKET